mgnify:CR=1 FL=1
MRGPELLRFRETLPELQQSHQEGQDPPPSVMDVNWSQTPDYYSVEGVNRHFTAPSSVRNVHGADTGMSAAMTRPDLTT